MIITHYMRLTQLLHYINSGKSLRAFKASVERILPAHADDGVPRHVETNVAFEASIGAGSSRGAVGRTVGVIVSLTSLLAFHCIFQCFCRCPYELELSLLRVIEKG